MISRQEAEEFIESQAQIGDGWIRQVAWAIRQGIPAAAGLSLEEYRLKIARTMPRLPVEERRPAARELTSPLEEGGQGLSQRQAAAALGVDEKTVRNDLRPEPAEFSAPAPGPESESKSEDEFPLADDTPEWYEPDDEKPEPEPAEFSAPAPGPVPPKPAVSRNSGDNEWYTPAEYVKSATAVLGAIDLDPASSAEANAVVGATGYWTEEDDGLSRPWFGRVWMNPPYAQPLCDRFCTRLAREYREGSVTAACVLVNNATETNWFQEVAAQASAMCFPRGRVKFWHPSKEATPLQGQAVLYLGPDVAAFRAEFNRFGFVVTL